MKIKKATEGIVLFFFLMVGTEVESQTSGNINVSFTNRAMFSLEMDRSEVSFGLVAPEQAGPKEISGAVVAKVRSNTKWVLTAIANDDLRSTDNLANFIPIQQLEFKPQALSSEIDYQNIYRPFSKTEPTVVASGNPTPDEGVKIISDYRLRIAWQNAAGNYSVLITYSLSAVP
ncbi:MAG: hypothetical protein AB1393_08275 [Candidatus Edwardsbacteria bacterium]